MSDRMHDPTAERAVLSAMMVSPLARQNARQHVTGADFYEPAHERMWDVLSRLDHHAKPVDHVTVLTLLQTSPDRIALDAMAKLTDIVTSVGEPDNVGVYAEMVRGWSLKRQMHAEGLRVVQQSLNPAANPVGLSASIVARFSTIRDSGITDDTDAVALGDLLDEADDEPEWLIPGLIERRDRLILTGEEGMGKSHLLRQLAIMAAAGLDPWDASRRFDPVKVTIIDCENTRGQLRARTRDLAGFATRYGEDPKRGVIVIPTNRLDITRDRDLARIHHELDRTDPDLVVIGPLYRLSPRAIQTDDEAGPVLAALDTIRDRGCALFMEAHAGHAIGKGGQRDMRPRGSSALLGWPEFGFGMRGIGAKGYCDFLAWRGQRSERDWPHRLRRTNDGRWVPVEDMNDYSHLQEPA